MSFVGLLLIIGYFTYNIIQVKKIMGTPGSDMEQFKLFLFALPIDLYEWIKSKF